ncbi:O-acyltransferase like protein-like isoform X1 [Epargyreus clarus]|uniref:O-acyltransferase like protein-like isoform X1 n=1 Tax=Epargyreus clarus TaxID=520877 RepID=UPI003C2B5FA2
MNKQQYLCIFISIFVINVEGHLNLVWDPPNSAFDTELYERVLDTAECSRQISFLRRNNSLLLARFLDAGIKVPNGIFIGNNVHLGNYHQCLGIHHNAQDMEIEGKYCMIQVPGNQSFHLPDLGPRNGFDPRQLIVDEEVVQQIGEINLRKAGFRNIFGADIRDDMRNFPGNPLVGTNFRLAICVPKPCTTQEFINGLLLNLTAFGFQYNDQFCRLNGDKPWSPADTAALVVFSVIGVLVLLSTSYDLWETIINKKDPKNVNAICRSFSVYTNTRGLLHFPPNPNAIECLDGVRALAMLWVIVGHAFSSQPFTYNNIDVFQWIISAKSLWIQAAHVTVDTFFMLSGLLVVYTTAGKVTSMKLIKNLHLFYLNRLLRMFPILATVVLLEASFFHRWFDGPVWGSAAANADRCRAFWWTTLLHVQNYVNPERVCIGATWYLAIDVQLHILSPIVLVWVLSGNNKVAWSALTMSLLGVLTAATLYCFQMEFPTGMMAPGRGHQMMYYLVYYYMNTLTRASPFMVGMVYGYLLHTWRRREIYIPVMVNILLWVISLALLGLVGYAVLPTIQMDWNNQTVDSLYNSFLRPTWAMALGWLIFACAKGYGGPVNWFLSLRVWKLPARLSYAMYLFHFSLMVVVNNSRSEPIWFFVDYIIFLFFAYTVLTFLVSFLATVVIDAPMSVFFKLLLDRGHFKKKDTAVNGNTHRPNRYADNKKYRSN